MYSERQHINAQFVAFFWGMVFMLVLCILTFGIFVLHFATFHVQEDLVGNLYVADPIVTGILGKIRLVITDLKNWGN